VLIEEVQKLSDEKEQLTRDTLLQKHEIALEMTEHKDR
jgi:hypothetical protein